MDEFYRYLEARSAELREMAAALSASGRADEGNFAKVKANIYEVCATVCKVHMNRPELGEKAFRAQLEKFRTLWGAEREKAAAHGDTQKQVIEELKLEALADAAAKFEEVCG